MEKIIGEKGSGKTTKLLELCHENGYIFVTPTYQSAKYAKDLAKSKGWNDVPIIAAHQFMSRSVGIPNIKEYKYVIDELDWFLQVAGVVGYSNGKD